MAELKEHEFDWSGPIPIVRVWSKGSVCLEEAVGNTNSIAGSLPGVEGIRGCFPLFWCDGSVWSFGSSVSGAGEVGDVASVTSIHSAKPSLSVTKSLVLHRLSVRGPVAESRWASSTPHWYGAFTFTPVVQFHVVLRALCHRLPPSECPLRCSHPAPSATASYALAPLLT